VLTSPRGFRNAILAALWVAVTSIVLRTSERVSFLAGPNPFAICETGAAAFDGLGVVFDLTRSAHDFGSAGGEGSFAESAAAEGDVSTTAGTDVEDERPACSVFDSCCGVSEARDTTLTESR
jgi:hypothetical protein